VTKRTKRHCYFRFGNILLQKLAAYRAAEEEVMQKLLCIELQWKKTSMQLEFIRSVWQELDVEHQRLQDQILQVLLEKLRLAIAGIERVSKRAADEESTYRRKTTVIVQRSKYALLKESLDSAIDDLTSWQSNFDPTWFLIMRIISPVIDRKLAEQSDSRAATVMTTATHVRTAIKNDSNQPAKLFLDDSQLKKVTILDIQFSAAKKFQRAGSSAWYILDIVTLPEGASSRQMKSDIRELARKLMSADPTTFGLLTCKGVVIETGFDTNLVKSFDFLFTVPKDLHTPQCLRARLLEANIDHSLSNRLKIAKQLAKSVSYIHTYGFVHKYIRPETILLFQDSQSTLAAAYLLGFEKFRLVSGNTFKGGDTSWETNIYRHPQRQGTHPEEYYVMQHDIYSVGVCLLEIGLWESFVGYSKDLKPVPSSKVQLADDFNTPVMIKEKLVHVARNFLPAKMGDIYTHVVISCLTCLDPDNGDFGDEAEFQDQDGVLVAVRYIEKVLLFQFFLYHICLHTLRLYFI